MIMRDSLGLGEINPVVKSRDQLFQEFEDDIRESSGSSDDDIEDFNSSPPLAKAPEYKENPFVP